MHTPVRTYTPYKCANQLQTLVVVSFLLQPRVFVTNLHIYLIGH